MSEIVLLVSIILSLPPPPLLVSSLLTLSLSPMHFIFCFGLSTPSLLSSFPPSPSLLESTSFFFACWQSLLRLWLEVSQRPVLLFAHLEL